jgi:hypothetical protein
MGVSVSYEPEPRDFAEAFREVGNRGLSRILRYAIGLGIPVAETISVATDAAVRSDPGRVVWQLVCWWVIFPLLFFGLLAIVRRWGVRRFIKDDATQKETQLRRLDDDGLHISGPGHSASISWSVLRSAVETSGFFLLFQTRDCAYFLPKRAMSSDAITQARALLRERLSSSRLFSD